MWFSYSTTDLHSKLHLEDHVHTLFECNRCACMYKPMAFNKLLVREYTANTYSHICNWNT